MRTFLSTLLVAATLIGGASAAYATSYGYGYSHGWQKKTHDARAFFAQQRKNSN